MGSKFDSVEHVASRPESLPSYGLESMAWWGVAVVKIKGGVPLALGGALWCLRRGRGWGLATGWWGVGACPPLGRRAPRPPRCGAWAACPWPEAHRRPLPAASGGRWRRRMAATEGKATEGKRRAGAKRKKRSAPPILSRAWCWRIGPPFFLVGGALESNDRPLSPKRRGSIEFSS